MGWLYRIDFSNGKSYVGITALRDAYARFKGHLQEAKKGSLRVVYKAMRKYECKFIPLVTADDWGYLCDLERRAISVFGTKHPGGYNLTEGGDGLNGYVWSMAAREKVAAVRRGQRLSTAHRAAISVRLKGRPSPTKGKKMPQHAARTSALFKGKPKSEEHRAKIAFSHIGIRHTYETCVNLAEIQRQLWVKRRARGVFRLGGPKKGQDFGAAGRAAQQANPELRERQRARMIARWARSRLT